MHDTQSKILLFCLTNRKELLSEVLKEMTSLLGPVEHQGDWHPFPKGHYYEKEMGPNLVRCVTSFEKIFDPAFLVLLKKKTNELEEKLSENGKRRMNIDPGYVDLYKVVLASNKKGGLKIALGDGIFAHLMLRYEKGKWLSLPNTFPDFLAPTYHKDLLSIRTKLKTKT